MYVNFTRYPRNLSSQFFKSRLSIPSRICRITTIQSIINASPLLPLWQPRYRLAAAITNEYAFSGAVPTYTLRWTNAGIARNPDSVCLWSAVAKRSGDTAFTEHMAPQAKAVSPLRFATALHIRSILRVNFLFFIGPVGR